MASEEVEKARKKSTKTRTALAVSETKATEIATAPMAIQPAPSAEKALQLAARQIEIRKGYIKLIAQQLRPEEVLVFGGRDNEEIYLPKRVCMDILSWAGIEIAFNDKMEEHHYQSPEGEFVEFVIEATVRDRSGRQVPVIGNRSTRDEFFGISGKEFLCPTCSEKLEKKLPFQGAKYKSWCCPTHKAVKANVKIHYLPLYDVDIASVRQAAVANLWNHAIEAIGLRPTLLDLKDAGMDIRKVKRIGFGSSKDDEEDAEAQRPQQSSQESAQQRSSSTPAQRPSASSSGPTKANIPSDMKGVSGKIEFVYSRGKDNKPLKTKKGTDFLKVIVGGIPYFVFDNAEKKIDDGKVKMRVFDLLNEVKTGTEVEFLANATQTDKGTLNQAVAFLRIGNLEWLEDGTPVLRRDAPFAENQDADPAPVKEGYQATDDDVPF